MGRIKTQRVKRASEELFTRHSGSFKSDFTENKKLVGGFAEIKSKKLRNMIAGYVTRLAKRGEA
ncbi:30S ribosomal protein S17e [Candidatus Woesearchaeota archaeon]|nr:30S ribosomal protein S17e [Candidatus Woesearchaeota archaeon]